MELEISKSMTINTGNYQSIRPTVSIKAEITEKEFSKKHEQISCLVENLFQIEVATLYAEQKDIDKMGINNYVNHIFKDIDMLMKKNKKLTEDLK